MLVLLTTFIQMSFHGRVKAGEWWGRRSEGRPGAAVWGCSGAAARASLVTTVQITWRTKAAGSEFLVTSSLPLSVCTALKFNKLHHRI